MAAPARRRLLLVLALIGMLAASALGGLGVWVARRRKARRLEAFTGVVEPLYDRLDHPDVSMVAMGTARYLADDVASVTIRFVAFGQGVRSPAADERTILCEVEVIGHHLGTADADAWEIRKVTWHDAADRTADLTDYLRRHPDVLVDVKAITDGSSVVGSALGGLSGASGGRR